MIIMYFLSVYSGILWSSWAVFAGKDGWLVSVLATVFSQITAMSLTYSNCFQDRLLLRWWFCWGSYCVCLCVFEPWHDKTNKWLCTQRRLRSVWTSAQSDQSSLSTWRKLGSFAAHWAHSKDWTDVQADLSLCWAHTHFVGFVMSWLISCSVLPCSLFSCLFSPV